MATSKASFVKLMELEAIGDQKDNTFMSKMPAWVPAGPATFGGHVYAQAVWAASQTVDRAFVVHNVHGYFTLPGRGDRPFIYDVSAISDGRSYCTRSVAVRQPVSPSTSLSPPSPTGPPAAITSFDPRDGEKERGKICFACICSFKKPSADPRQPSHQEVKNLGEVYAVALKGKKPGDHAPAPKADASRYYEYDSSVPQPDTFPGLDLRRVDMSSYNASLPPISYRQLAYYRAIGSMPPSQPNLHACAHLYASDRNSLFLISNALGIRGAVAKMGSLSHSVVFHVDGGELLFNRNGEGVKEEEESGQEGWFCQESWTPRSGDGRGMHETKIWDSRGRHIASSWQDGLVRKRLDGDEKAGTSGKL